VLQQRIPRTVVAARSSRSRIVIDLFVYFKFGIGLEFLTVPFILVQFVVPKIAASFGLVKTA
jgi:hypothetical protein